MGNQFLSQCKLDAQSHIRQPNAKSNILHHQNFTSQLNQLVKQSQTISIKYMRKIPQRSKKIDKIYQQLTKQKPIKYSIENPQFLQFYFKVRNLKELEAILATQQLKSINPQSNSSIKKQSLNNLPSVTHNNLSTNQQLQISQILLQGSSTLSQQSKTNKQLSHKPNIKVVSYFLQFPQKLQNQLYLLSGSKHKILQQKYASKSFERISVESIQTEELHQQNISRYDESLFNFYNQQYIYVGMIDEKGKPHGYGQLFQFENNNNEVIKFIEAEFINGQINHSDCIIIFSDQSYYRGGFFDGNLNQKGKIKLSNSFQLEGRFQNGLLQGKGKALYLDGGYYIGNFKNGKRQGKGKMSWRTSQASIEKITNEAKQITFQGFFANDKMNGLGHLRTPNYEYWGPFYNNMKQGKGTIKFRDNKKFEGWFEKDEINGYGELHHPDGRIEKGTFPFIKQ